MLPQSSPARYFSSIYLGDALGVVGKKIILSICVRACVCVFTQNMRPHILTPRAEIRYDGPHSPRKGQYVCLSLNRFGWPVTGWSCSWSLLESVTDFDFSLDERTDEEEDDLDESFDFGESYKRLSVTIANSFRGKGFCLLFSVLGSIVVSVTMCLIWVCRHYCLAVFYGCVMKCIFPFDALCRGCSRN